MAGIDPSGAAPVSHRCGRREDSTSREQYGMALPGGASPSCGEGAEFFTDFLHELARLSRQREGVWREEEDRVHGVLLRAFIAEKKEYITRVLSPTVLLQALDSWHQRLRHAQALEPALERVLVGISAGEDTIYVLDTPEWDRFLIWAAARAGKTRQDFIDQAAHL